MSHSKERHEKNCLNCQAEVQGRYCQVCGQENIEPKETAWGLISHFFYDITHFDGKFFSTTKLLLLKPGFLPKEYIQGRRASYLHPIRMYVFTSAVFFLFLYSVFNPRHMNWGDDKDEKQVEQTNSDAIKKLDSAKNAALAEAHTERDSVAIERAFVAAYAPFMKVTDVADTVVSSIKKSKLREKTIDKIVKYSSIAEYDSVQQALPREERDTRLDRLFKHRLIELRIRYKGDEDEMLKELLEKFLHTFPYLLFVSLPLYAFYLKLLYIRRKQFLYAEHGLFLIYLYIFTFILLLLEYGLYKLRTSMNWGWIGWFETVLILYGIYYAYKAMRKFYGQGRLKTFLKFWILNTFAFFTVIFLFTAFFLFAIWKI